MEILVLRRDKIDGEENQNENIGKNGIYNISYVNNILKIEVGVLLIDREFNGVINLDIKENKAYEVMLKATPFGLKLTQYEIFNFVSKDTGLKDNLIDGQKVARVVVDKDSNTIIIQLMLRCDEVVGCNNEIIEGAFISSELLASKCEWLKNRVSLIKKKSQMINEVDYYKSIAYLEAQVDLLTRVVLNFVNETELSNILKKADENSVLNIKPLSDIEKEFTESKYNLRKKQEEYYNLLHGE